MTALCRLIRYRAVQITLVPAGIVLCVTTLNSFSAALGFVLGLVGILGLIVWLLRSIIVIIAVARGGAWKQAAALLAAAVLSWPMAWLAAPLGDAIHVGILSPYYVWQARKSLDWGTRPTRFPWGDQAHFVTDGLRLKTVIYDPGGTTKAGDCPADAPLEGLMVHTSHLFGSFFVEWIMRD